jgi:hypothetical protein
VTRRRHIESTPESSPPEREAEGALEESESAEGLTPTPERATEKPAPAPAKRGTDGRFAGSGTQKKTPAELRQAIRLQTPRDLARLNRIIANSKDDKLVHACIQTKWIYGHGKVAAGGTPLVNIDVRGGSDTDAAALEGMTPEQAHRWLLGHPEAPMETYQHVQDRFEAAAAEPREAIAVEPVPDISANEIAATAAPSEPDAPIPTPAPTVPEPAPLLRPAPPMHPEVARVFGTLEYAGCDRSALRKRAEQTVRKRYQQSAQIEREMGHHARAAELLAELAAMGLE